MFLISGGGKNGEEEGVCSAIVEERIGGSINIKE